MTYNRVLLKLSGEALMGEKPYGIDPAIVQSISEDVSKVVENNVPVSYTHLTLPTSVPV